MGSLNYYPLKKPVEINDLLGKDFFWWLFYKKKEKKLGKLINFPAKIPYLLGKHTGWN
jgi:hypothetical protein